MRILWFSNGAIVSDSAGSRKHSGAPWIESLGMRLEQRKDIELAIVVQYPGETIKEEVIGCTKYFSTPLRTGRLKRKIGIGRHFVINDSQAIIDYLLIIDRFKPDIIQIFGTENNYGLLIPRTKIPVLVHLQGVLTLYHNKFYNAVSLWDVFRYTQFIDYFKGCDINRYFKFAVKEATREREILASTRYITGRTEWDRRVARIFAPTATYYHCEEMIRDNFFNYQWIHPSDDKICILSILRPNLYKGFDLILRTASLLKDKKVNFEWNIAGAVEDDRIVKVIKKKYKSESNALNNINFLGNRSLSELIELMKFSQLFVHPSYIENSPNSICEAMLAGMPVIVTYAGGVSSLIENQKEGILLQEGDPYSMAAAILELTEDYEFAEELGKNARARAKARHNPEKIVDTLLCIYKDILEKE